MDRKQYTAEERNFICMVYQKYKGKQNCYKQVIHEFSEKFPQIKTPSNSSVIRIWEKQQKFFTVHNLNSKDSPGDSFSGRPRSVRIEENISAVKAVLDGDTVKDPDDPSVNSCRRNVLGIKPTSWHNIATKDLKYHSYKLEKSHGLNPEDFPRRLRFARFFTNLSTRQMANIAYSDEATFCMDGEVNSQNVRRYAPAKVYGQPVGGKPDHFRHIHTKYPRKVMVFLGLHSSGKTFGLKFYEDKTIDGDEYWKLLRYTCIPQLKALNNPQGTLDGMMWQQDGARVHRTQKVLTYLDGQFDDRMIAMDSYQGHDWPARSPDCNPLDFFCWGYLKSKVFSPKPGSMEELKARIRQEVDRLDPAMIRRACMDVKGRCQKLIVSNGGYIE